VPGATNNHAMPVIGRTRSIRAGAGGRDGPSGDSGAGIPNVSGTAEPQSEPGPERCRSAAQSPVPPSRRRVRRARPLRGNRVLRGAT
jgi:hypothetical protein